MSQISPPRLKAEKRPRKPFSPRRSASVVRRGPATTRWSAIQKSAASAIDSMDAVLAERRATRVYRVPGRLTMRMLQDRHTSFDKLRTRKIGNGIFPNATKRGPHPELVEGRKIVL